MNGAANGDRAVRRQLEPSGLAWLLEAEIEGVAGAGGMDVMRHIVLIAEDQEIPDGRRDGLGRELFVALGYHDLGGCNRPRHQNGCNGKRDNVLHDRSRWLLEFLTIGAARAVRQD